MIHVVLLDYLPDTLRTFTFNNIENMLMAKKKTISKKKVAKKAAKKVAKKVTKKVAKKAAKKVATKKAKAAVDRRQVNIMIDDKAIKKLDNLRTKQGLTRSDLIMKLLKSAS